MNPGLSKSKTRQRGWALLVVMSLAATALLLMASIMSWSNENSTVVARNNETFATTYAAEAATEKVLAQVVQDDQDYGEGLVFSKTSTYSSMLPTASDNSYWTNYQFSGGTTNNTVIVRQVNANTTTVLGTPYSGLVCVGATYEIIANAQNLHSEYGIVATVGQRLLLAQIPIFQFAIFYNGYMEFDPGADMTVTGLVHGNTNMNLGPNSGVTLTFSTNVSSTGTMSIGANPYNSSSTGTGTVDFLIPPTSGVIPLNLPVGTNVSGTTTNTEGVNAIIQVPPAGESPSSSIGTNRLYNQADIIVLISNGNAITVTSGVEVNEQATVIPTNQWSLFLSTNGTFYNGREGLPVYPVNLNVGALRQWSSTNTLLRPVLAAAPSRSTSTADVESVFIADMRTQGTNYEPGIVLTNGAVLTSNGLSVVSPDPIYVVGNWNVATNVNSSGAPLNSTTQSYAVTNTLPSAIYTDAITILSPTWSPLNSSNGISSRVATPDTVNAAILTGNVPSTTSNYSGGVENFPRFLEDWTSVDFYYNGSMVQMFSSQIGKAPWPGTGVVYNPPVRDWAFDTNFLNMGQLPPLTPRIIYLQRAQWTTLPPRTQQF
jgi:hypothetical protein